MVYTYLFYQIHKSGSKTPWLVSMTLQGADSHLRGTLGGHCYHVNCVVHQSCFSLREKNKHREAFFNIPPSTGFNTEKHYPGLVIRKNPLLPSWALLGSLLLKMICLVWFCFQCKLLPYYFQVDSGKKMQKGACLQHHGMERSVNEPPVIQQHRSWLSREIGPTEHQVSISKVFTVFKHLTALGYLGCWH